MSVAMIGPKFYGFDRNGKPLAFGKLYTYAARTNTPKDTYQSEDQQVANTNPVILNGEGYANVYLDGSYKMVLKDSDENEIWSADPVTANEATEWNNCLSVTYLSPTSFKVAGNFVETYEVERRVRIDNNTASYSYSSILTSVFAAGETTVTIKDPVITTGVQGVCTSIIGFESVPQTFGIIRKLIDYDDINEWIASDDSSVYLTENYTLPSDITIPKGKKVIVLDGGTFTMTNTSFIWNGEIEAPRKHVFLYNGALADARITGTPETEEWLSDWFGVIPDGVTDYVATGRMFSLPNFSRKTGATIVFTSGLFKCGIDNNQSNTTFRCEPGAVFAGVVHAAINNSGLTNPELNPKNVKWIGKVTCLTRFGTYHCDGVDIEEVLVKDDAANSELGFAGGVHLFKDTKNLSCRKMTIEASKRNFGFGLDSDDALLPEGCWIGHLEIITTDVLGVYLRAKNTRIDSINIRGWGKGNAAGDPDLSLGLPGETDPAIVLKTYAFYALDCAGVSVGQLSIDGSNFGDIAEHGVLLNTGTVTIDMLNVRNSPAQNLKQLAGDHVITNLDSRLAIVDGIEQVGGSLSGTSLISDFNGDLGYKGAKNLIDLNLSYRKIRTNSNSGAGVDASSVTFNVDSWESKSNVAGVVNVTLSSPSGRIAKITTAASGVDTAGGLLVNGGTSQFDFSHDSTNEGYVAGNQYASYINGGSNRRITGMDIKGSSNQALRIVSAVESSIDHLRIPDGAGSGLVVAGLVNFSISNSVNTLSTNAAGQVVEFNNVGIT